jgi:predicted TPR repeat methyltransferase
MSDTSERSAEYFDAAAGIYETNVTRAEYFAPIWIARHVQDLVGLFECDVLDLGCGTGLNIKALYGHRTDIRAQGVDVSPKMLEQARATGLYQRLYVHNLGAGVPYIRYGRCRGDA